MSIRFMSHAAIAALCCACSLDPLAIPADAEDDGATVASSSVTAAQTGAGGGDASTAAGTGGADEPGVEPPDGPMGVPPCYADLDNGDGTCTRRVYAEVGKERSGYFEKVTQACPFEWTAPTGPDDEGELWYVVAYASAETAPLTKFRRESYLTFDTSDLAEGVEDILEAKLVVHHAGDVGASDNVLLFGGTQPLFGESLDVEDYDVADTLLGLAPMALIHLHDAARWTVPEVQLNVGGLTQFMVRLDRYCLNLGITSNDVGNHWAHHPPHASDPDKRPVLQVQYVPRER